MSKTNIEYLEEVLNLTAGCSPAGPGCLNCYARAMTHRLAANPVTRGKYAGLTVASTRVIPNPSIRGHRWTGAVRTFPERLDWPLHWRKPRVIGVCFLSDLFHEAAPDEFIAAALGVMAACPQHTFVVPTKRPERMARLCASRAFRMATAAAWSRVAPMGGWQREINGIDLMRGRCWPLSHVYLGASVSTQADLDAAAPHLAALAAGWRVWLSAEPLLEPLNLDAVALDQLAGVIIGAETGPGARPCERDWIESIVRQCACEDVACYLKSNAPARECCRWPRQVPWERRER